MDKKRDFPIGQIFYAYYHEDGRVYLGVLTGSGVIVESFNLEDWIEWLRANLQEACLLDIPKVFKEAFA